MEYFPNWLKSQIEILQAFQNTGAVTGWPVRITGGWAVSAANDLDSESGRFIPDEWERDYCDSVGRDWEQYKALTWVLQDRKVTQNGVSAYIMSQHCQFVCYPHLVEPFIEWSDRAMADESPFDEAIDRAGLLRLSTIERYTRHIGNKL